VFLLPVLYIKNPASLNPNYSKINMGSGSNICTKTCVITLANTLAGQGQSAYFASTFPFQRFKKSFAYVRS
jgi:hypothetical protein